MDNDYELIKKFQNGDDEAYNELIRRHLSNTIGFFYNITSDRMEAEDLAQDVFFKMHKYLKNFKYDSKFSTYLYRANMNTANSWYKRNKWRKFLHLDQTVEKGEIDHLLEDSWTRKELWVAVGKLPNKQRTIVMLRIAEELPYKKISEITGISIGSAKVNFHHALKKLKQVLEND